MKRLALLVFATLMAAEVHAACTINIQKEDLGRGRRYELSWQPSPGATKYTIESTRQQPDGSTVTYRENVTPRTNTMREEVSVASTEPVTVTYTVTATGGAEPCVGTLQITYPSDPNIERAMRKSTIPFVGSVLGANGSVFKTSLRLRGTRHNQRGFLIYHPSNTVATDFDPIIPYTLAGTASTLEWDDVVAAFGVSGTGSIDIVPEVAPDGSFTVPDAEVRLFNVAPNGTFGTIEWQTQAHDFHSSNPNAIRSLTVTVPAQELRLNLAIRTFEETTAQIELVRAGVSVVLREFTLSRDYLLFNSAAGFLGNDLRPGDAITMRILTGGAVPLYTLTDNRTNDPALFMPPVRVIHDVGVYQAGF